MNTVERVSANEAVRDPARLFREAAEGRHSFVIFNPDDTPEAAVLSAADLTDLQDDVELMSVLLVRAVSNSDKRYSHDDVMARFGYTQADLDSSSEACC
ncbi:hypothetical protein [Mycolicibacter sinensis]